MNMNNKNALDFFSKLVKNDSKVGVEKYGHDTTPIDAEFITTYLTSNISILDIGSGSGLILNKIEHMVGHIDAIEPYKEFSKHIIQSDRIKVININVFDFETNSKYDLITLFGFMHYFNTDEAQLIYKRCYNWMSNGAKIIIKNQFGVSEDVTVSGFSEELKSTYYAQYRYINNEIDILRNIGFYNVSVIDIYPPESNRFENTHFYAIVAEK